MTVGTDAMKKDENIPMRVRWALLRFSVVGPLLACPPESGELGSQLDALASRAYAHPTTGERIRFGRSTIEHWLYAARNATTNPVQVLERKVHARAGTHPSISAQLGEAIRAQYRSHPRWSYQLHHDNLRAQARVEPALGPVPSRVTLSRYMKAHGMVRSRSNRTLLRPTVRWASWDLSSVDLVDARTGVVLTTLRPLDKQANGDGRRRVLDAEPDPGPEPLPSGIAPLLQELMSEYAATGLPPAYVPMPTRRPEDES